MKKIRVSIQTVQWTDLYYDVPENKTPQEYIKELVEQDIDLVIDEEEHGFMQGEKIGLMLMVKYYLDELKKKFGITEEKIVQK